MFFQLPKRVGTYETKWINHVYIDTEHHFKGNWNNCDIFIGNLPKDFTIEKCLSILSLFGRVYTISLMIKDCLCPCKKNYGFARYHDPYFAEEASTGLSKLGLGIGIDFKVILTRRQREIHIGNVPTDMSDEELYHLFSLSFEGLEDIRSIKQYSRKRNTYDQINMGFAVMKFRNHGAAVKAIRRIKSSNELVCGNFLIATWIEPGKLHRHVILTGLSSTTSEQLIINLLQLSSKSGLVNYEWNNKNLYLQFRTNLQAEMAIAALNGKYLNGNILRMEWDIFPNSLSHKSVNMYCTICTPNVCYQRNNMSSISII